MKTFSGLLHYITFVILASFAFQLNSQELNNTDLLEKIDGEVRSLKDKGDIPGLSLVLIYKGKPIIRSYGFKDVAQQEKVTKETLFELGSTTKAFTALAVGKLIEEGKLDSETFVSDVLPWFEVYYEGEKRKITVEQLLHHTSGIPWSSIARITESDKPDALERTIRNINGIELKHLPGEEYHYATVNYDILALLVNKITDTPFEEFVETQILNPLRMENTSFGKPLADEKMAKGYKISFFRAREFEAPVYKGNNAAGYLVTNAEDIASWLKFQMGLTDTQLYSLAKWSHQRDTTVALHNMASYAKGWEISLDGTGEIFHGGLNPNFSSFIAFRKELETGVAVLTNSNSNYTSLIASRVMKIISGEELKAYPDPGDNNDKSFSILFVVFVLYSLIVTALISFVLFEVVTGKRKAKVPGTKGLLQLTGTTACLIPFLGAIYLIPKAIADFTWDAMFVWTPESLKYLIGSLVVAIALSYISYVTAKIWPNPDKYKKQVPAIILMSILSGLSNVILVIMVTSVIGSEIELKYLLFYYTLTLSLYLLGRRFVQVNLIKITRGIIYDLKIKLIKKIFSTSFENFEKIDKGRIYTSLNDDVDAIGQSASTFVGLITSIITAVGAFVYLASIAFWATVLTIGLIISLASIYYFVSQRTNSYFEKARDEQNVYMRFLNSMIDGFKELSLWRSKKEEFRRDISVSAKEFRDKRSFADIRFVNAFLIGESLLVVLLGIVAFGIPELFPEIPLYTVLSFVIILLYLIGPINGILNAVPTIMYLRVAWNRVQQFIKDIPKGSELGTTLARTNTISTFEACNVEYNYRDADGGKVFGVGPVNLNVSMGEIIFIIGGNGSGKTTFAKLLTGLYKPENGCFKINDTIVSSEVLGEYFSTVFSPSHLFQKLYSIDTEAKKEEIKHYLKILELDHKVSVENGAYSTIELSGGQRRRLALLQCFLEDAPIYLFDEWAADQDPAYRNFFYRTLLPQMKQKGKIVIAITHDDHYFDVADKILKMNQGVLEEIQDFQLVH